MKNKEILFVIALLILLTIVFVVWNMPNKYEKTFVDNGENEPYAQGVPLHEMDFAVYEDYFPDATSALGYNYERKIELPCDINYYASKEDSKPVLTLKKGTSVYVMPKDYAIPIGYGLQCWPDYEKSWRYGYVFLTEDFEYLLEDTEMYYVKSNELEKVADAFYQANQKAYSKRYSARKFTKLITQEIDEVLYRNGAYLSNALRDK